MSKKERRRAENGAEASERSEPAEKLKRKEYEAKLDELHMELVKMQYWIKSTGKKLVVLFEGRDAAGKGGAIKSIAEPLNPRGNRIVALGKPSDTEKTQWYYQRYVAHLPAAGEIVLFDRSWYNRAGVEHVMGFCTQVEYTEFLRSCLEFERMLINSGIILLKYWFSVSDEEQDRRFHDRAGNPARRWKLSEMDIQGREKWIEFSMAKDEMFRHTDAKHSPWYTVEADDKRRARLNCIAHLLSMIPYEDTTPPLLKLPRRKRPVETYVRPPMGEQNIVPDVTF
ncbi:MAG TPA: polyphosphate kinase 2 [Planctomycetaceae bacterium]|nr:polyphosphate kinase 2 [Planctomycetaceae bacterium]